LGHHSTNDKDDTANDIINVCPARMAGLLMQVVYDIENFCSIVKAAAITYLRKGWNISSCFYPPFVVVDQPVITEYGPYCGFTDHASQGPNVFAWVCLLDALLSEPVLLTTKVFGRTLRIS
jgi:hypothetical protein